jgi:hypothetical protein
MCRVLRQLVSKAGVDDRILNLRPKNDWPCFGRASARLHKAILLTVFEGEFTAVLSVRQVGTPKCQSICAQHPRSSRESGTSGQHATSQAVVWYEPCGMSTTFVSG